MVELFSRWLIAFLLAGLSFTGQSPRFEVGGKIALVASTYAFVLYLLERREMRTPTLSSWIAALDAALLGYVLAASGHMLTLGFLVLLPVVHAATRHRANPALVAPLATCGLVASANLVPHPPAYSTLILQSAGILLIGLFVSPKTESIVVQEAAPAPIEPLPMPTPQLDAELAKNYIELRENFRSLKDHFQSLQRRSRKDRLASQLYEAALSPGDRLQQRLAHKLREITGASAVQIYLTAEYKDALVVRAASGEIGEDLSMTSVPLRGALSETGVRQQFDLWVSSVRSQEESSRIRSVVLIVRKKVVGLISLVDDHAERLRQALEVAEEAAPTVAMLLQEELDSEMLRKRLREAELLYAVSSISQGAESAMAVASRVVRELWSALELDHLAVHFIDGNQSMTIATEGASANLFDAVRFGDQEGLAGWLACDGPEAALFDTTEDDRIPKRIALQKRVGSYAVIPIKFSIEPFGYLTAATHRSGGITIAHMETLRIIAAELSQAIARLESQQAVHGLATPREFQAALADASGCLVHLEPLRREAIVEEFGAPAYDHAVRQFARRIRGMLPQGGLVCRRSEGDYIVLLRDVAEPFAMSWANEASAIASMTAIMTPDGRSRIPLAFRAKVSQLKSDSPVLTTGTI